MEYSHPPQSRGNDGRWPDLRNTILLFVVGASVGMVLVSTWKTRPNFYQTSFGPAVMWTYGRGYVNPDLADAPELEAFLSTQFGPDVFPPSKLPAHVKTIPLEAFQKRELYLLLAVGLAWKCFGVAWSSLTPLYGILFGISSGAVYGLFRLGMNRFLAVFCTALLILSPLQLNNLVRLRDYSKAPFILVVLLLLGMLIKKPRAMPAVVGYSAICGAVTGIGLGFRIDVFICAGAFIPAIALFLPGKLVSGAALKTKAAAIAIYFLAFAVTSWPVLSELPKHGDKFHPALLGYAELYDNRLGVDSDYQLIHRYYDVEPMTLVHAFASQTEEAFAPARGETPEYEVMGNALYGAVLRTLPADFVVRAYASTLRILDELRAGSHNALPRGISNQFLQKVFELRAFLADTLFSYSRYAAVAALLILAAYDLRLAFATLFLLLFFGGYASYQFASRHYFHLEFFSIWAGGFLLMCAIRLAGKALSLEGRDTLMQTMKNRALWLGILRRPAIFAFVAVLGLTLPLWALRLYQQDRLGDILERLTSAELEALPIEERLSEDGQVRMTSPVVQDRLAPPAGDALQFQYEYLVSEFDTSEADLLVTVDYNASSWDGMLDWSVVLPRTPGLPHEDGTVTRLYFPAYYQSGLVSPGAWSEFNGLKIASGEAARLKGFFRLKDPSQCPLPLTAILGPDWRKRPHYQKMVR